MVNDAARILKVAGRRGKNAVGYQGLRLATITSVQPFSMEVDDIDCEYTSEDVFVNAQMLDFTYSGRLSAGGYSYEATLAAKSIFNVNDRVAVASVGINKFLIMCKVVSL